LCRQKSTRFWIFRVDLWNHHFFLGLLVADNIITFILTRTKQQKKKANKGPKLPGKPVQEQSMTAARLRAGWFLSVGVHFLKVSPWVVQYLSVGVHFLKVSPWVVQYHIICVVLVVFMWDS
jgi:hypothetical protein